MLDLTGKVAVVTGAGSGIGEATARLLAARGAIVGVLDVRREAAESVARQIRRNGGEALPLIADVSSEAAVASAVAAIVDLYGRIDILHNNAALLARDHLAADGLIADMDLTIWEDTMAVNLRGPMLCTKHVLPYMGSGGSIVMTGSGKGLQGDLDHPAYGVSKGGLVTLMRYVAAQYGKAGIRSNLVMVGLVLSAPIRAALSDEKRRLYEQHHLTPFLGEPSHVAEVVAFLASDAAAFVTGQVIGADGGYTSHSPLFAELTAQRATASP